MRSSTRASASGEGHDAHRERRAQRLQPQPLAQALERKRRGIGACRTGRRHHQDLAGERLEIRAEVHRALEREDPLLHGLDSHVTEHRLVGGLHLLRGEHHAHVAVLEHRHRSELHREALEHRSRAREVSVGERDHLELAGERHVPGHAGGFAETELRRAADSELVRLLRTRAVDEKSQDGIARIALDERGEQSRGIAIAARARIVLRIGEHDGRSDRAALRRACDRVLRRVQVEREFGLRVVDRAREAVDRAIDARLVGAVAEHRHLALGKVGHREARREGEHGVLLALDRGEEIVEPASGLDERRLRREPGQEVERPHGAREGRASRAQREQHVGGAPARLRHVDVRIGAIRHHAVGDLHHASGHVGVQVEARHDRHVRPHHATHAREDLAFAVVEMLGDHGAVEVEVDAVDGTHVGEVPRDLAHDALEGILGHVRRGRGGGPRETGRAMPCGVQRVEGAGGRDVGAGEAGHDRLAQRERRPRAALLECGEVRLARGEGIRLVLEAADGDGGHVVVCPVARAPRQFTFWAMRQSTPDGSMSTKSRIRHGCSSTLPMRTP